ncbi:MAG: hypothetical protein K5745_05385, partial [Saccharofermentans sp.]|nr:hypothetical protein [Saccharofermentans sp.]
MNKTNKTLAVVSLISVILSFVGIALFYSSAGILTKAGNINETVDVTVEDGKVVTEPLIEELTVDKDAYYSLDYSWIATEERHITGLVVRDEDGRALDYATGDTTEGVMEGTLDKGDYTLEFIFMANEEEVRCFFEENVPDMSEEDLDKFIEDIDFDAIPDNCTTVVTYNIDISKSAFDSRIGMVITLAITVAAIISLLLLRAKYKGDEELKGRLTAIGPSYAAFGIIVTLTQLAISLIASLAFPELLRDHQILVSMLLIVVSVDLIGLPTIWMLLKKVEISKPEKTKFSIVKLIKYICISATLTGVGAIVGTIFELILSGT